LFGRERLYRHVYGQADLADDGDEIGIAPALNDLAVFEAINVYG